ncbi:MAG: hypothetical protein DCF20_13760 [Pseudanabaena sp.]|nr:MAG: hypothetical protein DCF20_13760 [Pseudanabaena sp.]
MSVFRESIAPRKRRVSLVFSVKIGSASKSRSQILGAAGGFAFSDVLLCALRCGAIASINLFQKPYAIALQNHIPKAKQQYRS